MRKQALILFLIFVVSCAPQTAVPTSANTETPIAKSTPTVVTNILMPSTATAQPTPELDVSSYRLKKWSQEDYQTARDLAVETQDFGLFPYSNTNYLTTVQFERLLKFPDAKTREDVTWDLWLADQQGFIPEFQPGQDLLAMHLIEQLNAGESLKIVFTKLKNRDVVLLNDLLIQNLVGNGQMVHVLTVKLRTSFEGLTAVYAVFPQQGTYKVMKIQDWFISEFVSSGVEVELFDVGDTNGNDLPELVIENWAHWSGMPAATISESISYLEWNPEKKVFTSHTFPVVYQNCEQGSCEGKWEFLQENLNYFLRIQSDWKTLEECPNLILQTTYLWDGESYALIGEEPIQPESSISSECRFAWADTYVWVKNDKGWAKDSVIANAEKSLQTWDSDESGKYGPDGKDYAKLRLGIWHDLRNENQQAVSLLSSLVQSPSLPEYDFTSRLAGIYLDARNTQGKSEACNAIGTAYQTEFIDKVSDPNYFFPNDQATLQLWGIIEPRDEFCRFSEMFSSEISDTKISSFTVLEDWLSTKDVKVNQSIAVDLNNDKREDINLVLLDRENEEGLELWSFKNSSGKLEAEPVTWYEEKSPVKMSHLPFASTDGSNYYLLNISKELSIVKIPQDGKVEVPHEKNNVQSYEMEIDSLVVTSKEYYCDVFHKEQWNLETGDEILLLNLYEIVQPEIENKLFNDKNYSGTIDYIDTFLRSAPPEPRKISSSGSGVPDGCTFHPPFFVPYYRYLRGLAYEQLGEDTQAVRVYYEIWKDYPDNFFGIIARLKLEPITP